MSRIQPVPLIGLLVLVLNLCSNPAAAQPDGESPSTRRLQRGATTSTRGDAVEYRVLATSRTSTMERELNRAAEEGFRFRTVMGGNTAFGGSEAVVIVTRTSAAARRSSYRLLATSRTSTMERELNEAAEDGFRYRGQTVFDTAFGGEEVVVILERGDDAESVPMEYLLLATSQTSTLQEELDEAGRAGYEVLSLTVGSTALGGEELVAILERPRAL